MVIRREAGEMNARAGLWSYSVREENELNQPAFERLKKDTRTVFSHLRSADIPGKKGFSQDQTAFIYKTISETFLKQNKIHLITPKTGGRRK